MHLIRSLYMYSAQHNIIILLEHLLALFIADLMSCLQVLNQIQLVPETEEDQATIPDSVWKLCQHTQFNRIIIAQYLLFSLLR